MLPGATQPHVPDDLGFLPPGASIALPVGSDDFNRRSAQAFEMPTDDASSGSIWQLEATERAPPPGLSLSAPLNTYGFLPRQGFDTTQPRHRGNAEHSQLDMAGEGLNAFGLQPLAYGEPMSFLPSVDASIDISASISASTSASRVETPVYAQLEPYHGPTDATTMEIGDYVDTGMLSMDDALNRAWSNLPPAIMGPG